MRETEDELVDHYVTYERDHDSFKGAWGTNVLTAAP